MNRRPEAHWFLDRWCAEMVVEDWLSVPEAARRAGTTDSYVARSVREVYGCGVMEARARAAARQEQRA